MIGRITRMGICVLLLVFSSLSVAAAPDQFSNGIEHAHYLGATRLDGEVFHLQGLALDGPRIWVTSVDQANHKGYIHEFDRTSGRFLRRLELTDAQRYHPGGISMAGRSIWVPVAEFKPNSSAVLVEIDADSLKIRCKIHVADHLGCVAASARTLVAGNWDSALLYVFDAASGKQLRIVPNPTATRYQDMKFVGNQLVAGGVLSLWSGALDWIDWPSLRLRRSVRAGALARSNPLGAAGLILARAWPSRAGTSICYPKTAPATSFISGWMASRQAPPPRKAQERAGSQSVRAGQSGLIANTSKPATTQAAAQASNPGAIIAPNDTRALTCKASTAPNTVGKVFARFI